VPREVNIKSIVEDITAIDGVQGIHTLHIWSICSNIHAMSAHIDMEEKAKNRRGKILELINQKLVKDNHIDQACLFQRQPVSHQDPVSGRDRGCIRGHEGNGETEGVRTRDHQNGDGAGNREVDAPVADGEPDEEGGDRDRDGDDGHQAVYGQVGAGRHGVDEVIGHMFIRLAGRDDDQVRHALRRDVDIDNGHPHPL